MVLRAAGQPIGTRRGAPDIAHPAAQGRASSAGVQPGRPDAPNLCRRPSAHSACDGSGYNIFATARLPIRNHDFRGVLRLNEWLIRRIRSTLSQHGAPNEALILPTFPPIQSLERRMVTPTGGVGSTRI